MTAKGFFGSLVEVTPSNVDWADSFALNNIRILIVCRGPVRMEALQVFGDLGAICGILLSEKDSVSYTHTLAPELRVLPNQQQIHRVADYSGTNQKERKECISQIIAIAKAHHYDYIFAGYGFMAEDGGFVEELEQAGIGFIGPSSSVHRQAGAKDTAKAIARKLEVSVTPGVDNITALSLLSKAGQSKEGLISIADHHGLDVQIESKVDKDKQALEADAEAILQKGYQNNIGLISTQDIQQEAKLASERILKAHPDSRIRLKYIGGGGGKGQRVIQKAEQVPDAVMEVLSEAKALGEADNKNFLIELNIENIRHNEIQLLGNGDWCISLGGRDCSLQMHEQKLVELSLTDELFEQEITIAKQEGAEQIVNVLTKDRQMLAQMEEQAVCFANAIGLDSASTFETIVTKDSFFFMEVNTRIQVEHRVSEMAYRLRFCHPQDPSVFFDVDSLLAAMALIAVYGKSLPCPERIPRHTAGGEIRLNAQNEILQPAAGGLIEFWSAPLLEKELRDDQGIQIRDPDTGDFIRYYLAGAYDSNIALLVTYGKNRRENLENIVEILRCMEIRGQDLQTNLDFHYGIVNFYVSLHPMAKPTTSFVSSYLLAVGSLALELEKLDLNYAWELIYKQAQDHYGKDGIDILKKKQTLILRPLQILQKNPHICAGWLMRNFRRAFDFHSQNKEKLVQLVWKRNPWRVLSDLYHYLHLETRQGAAPIQQIWPDDYHLLEEGLSFYLTLERELDIDSDVDFHRSIQSSQINSSMNYLNLVTALEGNGHASKTANTTLGKLDESEQQNCRILNSGWQLGLSLLDLFIHASRVSGILQLSVRDDLTISVPEIFDEHVDDVNAKKYLKALSVPVLRSADMIVAQAGGMFYLRETPDSPPYLQVGSHFDAGDTIYIIEVMKMFNKVTAEFSGTVEEILIAEDQGKVIKKGQPLFRVRPDEKIEIESEEQKYQRRTQHTKDLYQQISL